MELARSMHYDLTTGEVAAAREPLGTMTRDLPSLERGLDVAQRKQIYVDARTAYFTLLWCFERIWSARNLMTGDRDGALARDFLDRLVGWHVRNWASDLPMIKRTISQALANPVLDADSSKAFARLSRELLSSEDWRKLCRTLEEKGLQPLGGVDQRQLSSS